MRSYDTNLYYSPEASGYEIIETIELEDEPWQFDILVVWRDPEGTLVWATDSGCSCPSPFEIIEPEDLYNYDYEVIESFVRSRVGSEGALAMQAEDALARLRKL